jgi:hypothetical protein
MTAIAATLALGALLSNAPETPTPVSPPSTVPITFDCDSKTVQPKLASTRSELGMSVEEAFVYGERSPSCIFLSDLHGNSYTSLAVIISNCEQPYCGGFLRILRQDGHWLRGSRPFLVAKTGAKLLFYSGRPVPDLLEPAPPGLSGGDFRMAWSGNDELYVPVANAAAAAAVVQRDADAMTFRLVSAPEHCADLPCIAAEGVIVGQTASEFFEFLNRNRVAPGTRILLNSPGGDIEAAMQIGSEIREKKLSTEVARVVATDNRFHVSKGECFSACSFVFVGGVAREVPPDGLLGFHWVRVPDGGDPRLFNPDWATVLLRDYVLRNDVHGDLVLFARAVQPSKMCLLTRSQLERWNVVTTGSQKRLPRESPDAEVRFEAALKALTIAAQHPERREKARRISVRVACFE